MEGSNNQGDDYISDNDNVDDNDSDDEEADWYYLLDKTNFLQLKKNDISMTNICVDFYSEGHEGQSYFNNIAWEIGGDSISDNKYLKKMTIKFSGRSYILGEEGHNLPTREQLQAFFSCVYRNCSIEILEIYGIDVSDEFGGSLIEGLSGHQSIATLQISHSDLGSVGFSALGKVLKHPKSKLKHFRLGKLDDDEFGIVCDGLLGNNTMKSLCLNSIKKITSIGWQAFSTVLQHPNCKLIELDLSNADKSNDTANVLGSALSSSSSIRVLNLSSNYKFGSLDWQTLFNQLSQTSVEDLDLSSNNIDDTALNALAGISTLKSLNLKYLRSINSTGWQSFFASLQTRGVQLKKLILSGNNKLGRAGAAALGSYLSDMRTLKVLKMSGYLDSITPQGWQAIFISLQDPNLALTRLDLDSNLIGYEEMELLMRSVSNMSSMKCLDLGNMRLLSAAGWRQALSGYNALQDSNLDLVKLDVSYNNIDDEGIQLLIGIVSRMSSLAHLNLNGSRAVTPTGCKPSPDTSRVPTLS